MCEWCTACKNENQIAVALSSDSLPADVAYVGLVVVDQQEAVSFEIILWIGFENVSQPPMVMKSCHPSIWAG